MSQSLNEKGETLYLVIEAVLLALYEIAKATSGVQSRIQLKESAESTC